MKDTKIELQLQPGITATMSEELFNCFLEAEIEKQKLEKSIEIISIGEEEPVEKDIEIIKDEQVCGELLSVAAAINSLKFAIIKEFEKAELREKQAAAINSLKFAIIKEFEKAELREKQKAIAAAYSLSPERIEEISNSKKSWLDNLEEVIKALKEFGKEQKKKHNNFRDKLPKKTRKRKVW
jgi:hypothetical protein